MAAFQELSNALLSAPSWRTIIRISDQARICYTLGTLDILVEGSIEVVEIDVSQQTEK